ncbi:hypothetical protein JCGZ_02995 [Jatropha curcas]|uniref:Uncharacterized protein n=1 Tax=Jatropha curcas TaxID=180498 RepID=A0A067JDX6_JATCU|nr:hypothetical protein JCGZ_02995 [Jatropha curcas]
MLGILNLVGNLASGNKDKESMSTTSLSNFGGHIIQVQGRVCRFSSRTLLEVVGPVPPAEAPFPFLLPSSAIRAVLWAANASFILASILASSCSIRFWMSVSDAIDAGRVAGVVGETGKAGEVGDNTVGVTGTWIGTGVVGT